MRSSANLPLSVTEFGWSKSSEEKWAGIFRPVELGIASACLRSVHYLAGFSSQIQDDLESPLSPLLRCSGHKIILASASFLGSTNHGTFLRGRAYWRAENFVHSAMRSRISRHLHQIGAQNDTAILASITWPSCQCFFFSFGFSISPCIITKIPFHFSIVQHF